MQKIFWSKMNSFLSKDLQNNYEPSLYYKTIQKIISSSCLAEFPGRKLGQR